MFFRIIFSGLILFVDYAVGNCGFCQTNHVACHSEDTFSLCVEGKPTHYVIRCPEGKICASVKDICVRKNNSEVKATCVAACNVCGSQGRVFSCVGKKNFEFCFGEEQPFERTRGSCLEGYVCDNTQSQICVHESDSKPSCVDDLLVTNGGNYYENIDAQRTDITTRTPDSNETQKGATFPTTKDSKTTYSTNVGISSDQSTTPSQKGETPSSTEGSFTILETSTKDGGISLITEDSSTTEFQKGAHPSSTQDPHTSEPTQSSSLSTQDLASSDFSTDGVESTTHLFRNARTFCSENKEIGTFMAEGDNTFKRYFICTTNKGVFRGYEYNCGSNYFNADTRMCQAEIPVVNILLF